MSIGETLNTVSDNALDNADLYYNGSTYLKPSADEDEYAFRNEFFALPPSDELRGRDGVYPRAETHSSPSYGSQSPPSAPADLAPSSSPARGSTPPGPSATRFTVDLPMVRRTMAGINSILGVKLGDAEVGPSALLEAPTEDMKDVAAKSEMSHFRIICDACGFIVASVGRAVLAAARDAARDAAPADLASFRPKPPLRKRRGGILGFKELALRAGLSPWHFHRVFRYITGVTPKTYGEALWEYLMIEANFDLDNEELLLVNYMNKDGSASNASQSPRESPPDADSRARAPERRAPDRAAPLAGSVPAGRVRKTSSLSRGATSRSRTRTHTHGRTASLSAFALEGTTEEGVARGRSFSSNNRRSRVFSNHDEDGRRNVSLSLGPRIQPADLFELSKGTDTFQDTPAAEETPDVAALSLQQQLKPDPGFEQPIFPSSGDFAFDREFARAFDDPRPDQLLDYQRHQDVDPAAQQQPAQPQPLAPPQAQTALDFDLEFVSRPAPLGSFDEIPSDLYYNYDKRVRPAVPAPARTSMHENLQHELLNDTFPDDLTLNVLDELPTSFYANANDRTYELSADPTERPLANAPELMAWHEPADALNYPF